MSSSKDFFDIPTTVWNISMMSIYVVLSTSTNLLTNSSTCFSIISTMLIYVLLLFFYVFLHCTYTWFLYIYTMLIYVLLLSFYVFLHCTYTWFWNISTMLIYVISIHIYDVDLRTFCCSSTCFYIVLIRDFGTYLRC